MLQQFRDESKKLLSTCLNFNLISRCTVSMILVFLTQFALYLVPCFFSASPLIVQLSLSVLVILLVLGFGRWCRRVVGVHASAPALVFFNVLFVWAVYIVFVRKVISHFIDVVFNVEVAMLFTGLCSILSSDPGLVTNGASNSDKLVQTEAFGVEAHNEIVSALFKRVRYCKSCKAYVKGFDHHCPAFGNCIGQNNYVLFMVLLVGFLSSEVLYIVCSSQRSHMLAGTMLEANLASNLVISTMLFSLLQVLWQGLFLIWHVYCICFNIRTDEWINWKKYPEFHLIVPQPGESLTDVMFRNPYDKGILQNIKDFFPVGGWWY